MNPQVVVVVRRYDVPEVKYGFHYADLTEEANQGFLETKHPNLLPEDQASLLIHGLLIDGFVEIETPTDWTPSTIWPRYTLWRFIKRSCPIEFHSGLESNDRKILNRIRVFTKGME